MRYRCVLLFLIIQIGATAQVKKKVREFKRDFQFSLFPGISSNGIISAYFYNKYSINLFGGLSAGNQYFEAGLITNVNLKSSTGIQIAGSR